MKKYIGFLFLAFLVMPSLTRASVIDNQSITLSPGWNIVSTPKVLLSHHFSASEVSTNFDIYLLNPTSISGWQTMSGAGQTEFQPLYAYFINNKTGSDQTLQFNYNFSISPSQRLFQRTLQTGWNAIGVASPSYAIPQGLTSVDTNNPSNIINSISDSISEVIDFTNTNANLDSPSISNNWLSKTVSDVNILNDLRELKGYGVFVTNPTNNYLGSQSLLVPDITKPVITLVGDSTINLTVGDSYTDAGATASDNVDGNITANIVTVNPVNTSVAGTYTVTYNVSDAYGNNAIQISRTVNVVPIPGVEVSLVSATATAIPSTQGVSGYATGTFVFTVKPTGISLAKLTDNLSYIGITGTNMGSNVNYTINPNTTISDGNQATITLTASKITETAGFVKFEITGLTFENSDLTSTTAVTSGLTNFYTNSVYAN
ncbi:MAG: immunoglobulin-like domain-containing protein [Candidatus Nomurabacteria bacterium]